jgi:tRNA A-37 threonylcarbamoyl transferase component Bud32
MSEMSDIPENPTVDLITPCRKGGKDTVMNPSQLKTGLVDTLLVNQSIEAYVETTPSMVEESADLDEADHSRATADFDYSPSLIERLSKQDTGDVPDRTIPITASMIFDIMGLDTYAALSKKSGTSEMDVSEQDSPAKPVPRSIFPVELPKFDGKNLMLKGVLGRGGMADVYLAETADGDEVAVKMFNPSYSEAANPDNAVRLFLDELRNTQDAGSYEVIASGFCDGPDTYYLITEVVDGTNLHTLWVENPEWLQDPEIVRNMGVAIAEELDRVHRKGVIHRDVKPDNLLGEFDLETGDTRITILDYGVAERMPETEVDVDGNKKVNGQSKYVEVRGTPHYMPREAFRGRLGPQIDIYGASVALYEFATGERHLKKEDGTEPTALDIATGENLLPVAPPHLISRCPPELSAVIMKGIAEKPEDRYQSGAELAEALRTLEIEQPE